jgi:hypothetical protein
MKRYLLALVLGGALLALVTLPASAAKGPGTFTTAACLDTVTNAMVVTSTWSNEAPDGTSGTLDFRYVWAGASPGAGVYTATDDGALPSDTFHTSFLLQVGDSWSNYTKVKVSTSGYFKAGPVVIPQSAAGWTPCS